MRLRFRGETASWTWDHQVVHGNSTFSLYPIIEQGSQEIAYLVHHLVYLTGSQFKLFVSLVDFAIHKVVNDELGWLWVIRSCSNGRRRQ